MAESAISYPHSAEPELRMDSMERRGQSVQLSFLCPCGKRIALKTLGCCRSCYDRRHHSLRFFGGLREHVLEGTAFAAVVVASVRRWWSIIATGTTGRICWSPCASAAIYASITRRDGDTGSQKCW